MGTLSRWRHTFIWLVKGNQGGLNDKVKYGEDVTAVIKSPNKKKVIQNKGFWKRIFK